MMIKLEDKNLSLIEAMKTYGAWIRNEHDKSYLYFPFWVELNADGAFLHPLGELPAEVVKEIEADRDYINRMVPSELKSRWDALNVLPLTPKEAFKLENDEHL